jgi:hypothetical protein
VYKYINNKTINKDGIRALIDKDNKVIIDPGLFGDTLNDWFFSVFKKEDCENMPTCTNPSSL